MLLRSLLQASGARVQDEGWGIAQQTMKCVLTKDLERTLITFLREPRPCWAVWEVTWEIGKLCLPGHSDPDKAGLATLALQCKQQWKMLS